MGTEYEAQNVTPPLKNSTGMKCILVLMATPTSQVVDLSTHFARLDAGHYLSLLADGAKIYIAQASNSSGSIDETATGSGASACIPIPDGTQLPARPISGLEQTTGYATLCKYNFLHYKATATSYLRVYRSSVGPNQGSEQFKAP